MIKWQVDQTVETDVLVVGAGVAGCRAAIASAEKGARTIIACKGTFARSGTSNFPGPGSAWQAADGCSGEKDSPEVHFQDIMDAAQGMADAKLAWILAQEAPDHLKELESWGFHLCFDPKGLKQHYTGYSCFASQPRAHGMRGTTQGGHTGNMTAILRDRALTTSVTVHDHTTLIDLLVDDEQCMGALAVSPDNKLLVYRAGAVILTTGGAAQIFPRSLTPPDITGDGYAMVLRAGAELTNIEFIQYMLRPIVGQPPNTGKPIWACHPTLRNRWGEHFLCKYLPVGISASQVFELRTRHYPFSCSDQSRWLDIAIANEVRAGRGTTNGGVLVDFSQADWSAAEHSRPQHLPPTNPITVGDSTIEVAHLGHANNGGVRADESGHSRISGLFVAGEMMAGPHGADRLGGGMLAACNVFGKRAGEASAVFAKGVTRAALKPRTLEAVNNRAKQWGVLSPFDLASIRSHLREQTGQHLMVLRNREGLEMMITKVAEMRSDLYARSKELSPDGIKAKSEIDNMLLVAELIARAALLREESRGSHYREDYPNKDELSWGSTIGWRICTGQLRSACQRGEHDPIGLKKGPARGGRGQPPA